MIIETDRLILLEMTEDDFDAMYAVLGDSDIMQHYPYTFDEERVRGWIRRNIERYEFTKVYAISREEWERLKNEENYND